MTRYKGRQSAKAKTLSAKRLRKLLNYAPETGVFRWRVRRGRNNVGTVAGSIHPPKGYRLICIDGKIYRSKPARVVLHDWQVAEAGNRLHQPQNIRRPMGQPAGDDTFAEGGSHADAQ